MADADALQFRISARPDYKPVLRQMTQDADAAQARFSGAATKASGRVAAEAQSARAAFTRMSEPLRKLSPELDRAHSTLERMGKASAAVRSMLQGSRAASAATAKSQADTLSKMRKEAEQGAHAAANKAADRVASRFGLGRFSGTDDIREIGSRYFGGEREAAAPDTLARAQREEGSAYESAFKQHMSEAERAIGDTAKGFEEAGVAAEGAEAGVGALVGTIGGLALAAVAAGVAVEVMAAKVSSKFARTGQGIENAAALSGLDPTVLQRWRGAAERSGVDPGAAEQALGGFGLKLHNLSYGMGDAGTANMLAQMGIAIPKPGEAVDVDAATKQVLDKLQAIKDPFTRLNTANALGLGALVPLARGGSAGVTADQAATDKTGSIYTGEDIAKADAQARRLTDFRQSQAGFMKRAGSVATDISAPGLGLASAAVQGADVGKVRDLLGGMVKSAGGASGAMDAVSGAAHGAAKALGDLIAPAAHAAEPGERRYRRDVDVSRGYASPGSAFIRPPLHGGVQATISKGAYAALNPAVLQNILDASQRFGVDPSIMIQEGYRESGFRSRSRPGTSSAAGMYQFTTPTWLQVLHDHGAQAGYADQAAKVRFDPKADPRHRYSVSQADKQSVMELRVDPRASAMMGAAYMRQNADDLRPHIGRDPTAADLYASHFFGPRQSERFLNEAAMRPNEDAARAFPTEAASNRGVFSPHGQDLNLQQLLDAFAKSMRGEITIKIEENGRVSSVTSSGASGLDLKVAKTR